MNANQNNYQSQNSDAQRSQQSSFDNQAQYKCNNCGFGTTPTADICENCGEWLLKGKCNFCYADVEQGQRFCAECGNPPLGIVCDSCGTLSHFDFCPKCNIALTRQSNDMIQMIGNSVEFQNVMHALSFHEEGTIDEAGQVQGMDTLKNYLTKFTEKKTKKKTGFTLNDKSAGKVEENLKNVEQLKPTVSSDQTKDQKEQLAMKLLEDTKAKQFPNNQEARKFFGALKVLLPQVIQKKDPIGWRCNAYFNLHPNGPQECSATCTGGTWVYDTNKETDYNLTSI